MEKFHLSGACIVYVLVDGDHILIYSRRHVLVQLIHIYTYIYYRLLNACQCVYLSNYVAIHTFITYMSLRPTFIIHMHAKT